MKVNPEMDFLLGSNAALKVSCLVGGHWAHCPDGVASFVRGSDKAFVRVIFSCLYAFLGVAHAERYTTAVSKTHLPLKGPLLMRCSDGLPHYSNLTMNLIKVACMQDFQWGNYSTLESINQTLINVMIWKEMNVRFKSDCSRHFMLPSDPKLSNVRTVLVS